MTTLTLWIVLFSFVALGQQNYITFVDPYRYWLGRLDNDNGFNWDYQSADDAGQVQNRSPNPVYSRPASNAMSRFRPFYVQPEQRLFFGALSNLFPNLFGGSSSSPPSTSYVFVPSTPTSTITSYCTESTAFLSTTPCAVRRRRGIALQEFDDQVQSTAVLPMASSSVGSSENDIFKREIAIASSKDEEISQFLTPTDLQGGEFRVFGRAGTSPSTVTVTVTTLASPSLITTTKTVSSTSIAGTAQLQCLSPGAVVCK